MAPALYFACVGLSVLITGISKSGFGGGVGIVAIPLMGAVMPASHMLGVQLPLLVVADALSNLHHLKHREWRLLRPMLAGAAVGLVAGTAALWLLQRSDPRTVQRLLAGFIGAICLIFVAVQAAGLFGRKPPTLPSHPASSVAVGATSGVVSTLAHAAGPIVTLYLLQEKLDRRFLVGTQVFFFLLVNTAKLPTYAALGTINARTLHDSIWFIPLIPIGTLIGAWMNRRVPEKPFAAILYVAAAATAGQMLWSAMR